MQRNIFLNFQIYKLIFLSWPKATANSPPPSKDVTFFIQKHWVIPSLGEGEVSFSPYQGKYFQRFLCVLNKLVSFFFEIKIFRDNLLDFKFLQIFSILSGIFFKIENIGFFLIRYWKSDILGGSLLYFEKHFNFYIIFEIGFPSSWKYIILS